MQSPRFHTRVCLINAFVSGLSRIRVDLVLTERFKLANSPVFCVFLLFFYCKNCRNIQTQGTRHEYIPTKNNHTNKEKNKYSGFAYIKLWNYLYREVQK